MLQRGLVVLVCAWIVALVGCATPEFTWIRSGFNEAPKFSEVNGELVPFTPALMLKIFGPPTCTIETADGKVCIWRRATAKAHERTYFDQIVGFDREGNFRPVDISADYGFCPHCAADLRSGGWTPTSRPARCPACGKPIAAR